MTKEELLILRRGRGLTQEDLAGSLGVRREAVSRWEKGVHSVPDDIAEKIAALMPEAAERKASSLPAEIVTRRWRPYPWANRDYTLVELGKVSAGLLVWRLCLDVREPQWEVLKATTKGRFQYADSPEIVMPVEAFPEPLGQAAPWAADMFAQRAAVANAKRLELKAFHEELGIPEEKFDK